MNRLRELRLQHGKTQQDIANYLNLTPKAISFYEKEQRDIPNAILKKLAKYFNVTTDYLLGNDDALLSIESIGSPVTMIPIYGRIVAGEPCEAMQEIIGYTGIPKDTADAGDYFALKVFGESMEPTFSDGDLIIVKKQKTVDSGQIAVVLIDNEDATVKRVFIEPEGITISADNPSVFRQRFYSNEEIELLPVIILGRVVSFSREL